MLTSGCPVGLVEDGTTAAVSASTHPWPRWMITVLSVHFVNWCVIHHVAVSLRVSLFAGLTGLDWSRVYYYAHADTYNTIYV